MKSTVENPEKIKVLKQLGFKREGSRWSHKYIPDESFDFSASSIEGLVKCIYEQVYEKNLKENVDMKR